jgi:hypothetical protein
MIVTPDTSILMSYCHQIGNCCRFLVDQTFTPRLYDYMFKIADGLMIQEILDDWLKLKPTIMAEWQEDKDSLVDLFGRVRDDWIKNDFSGWIGANR